MPKRRTKKAPDLSYISKDLRPLARPISELTVDPENLRTHPKRNRDLLHKSMAKYGQRRPAVVRADGMLIEAGNCMLEVAAQLGWTHLAVVVEDDDEDAAREYALLDNRTAELAEWDPSLSSALRSMVEGGTPIEDLGWTDEELADLPEWSPPEGGDLGGGSPPDNEMKPEDDEIHEPPAEPITVLGDMVELGEHVLHCADCMDVMHTLADNSVDAVVTDPPYGLSPDGRARTWDDIAKLRAQGKGPKRGFMGKDWDAGVPGITWAKELLRVLKPGAHVIAFSATRTMHRLTTALEDAGFEIRDQIGWLQWQGFPHTLDVSKGIDDKLGHERPDRKTGPAMPQSRSLAAGARAVLNKGTPVSDEAKAWDGWSTGLKPSQEPAVLARKPLAGTVVDTVLKYGTGALNIDACRIPPKDPAWPGPSGDVPVFTRPESYDASSYHIPGGHDSQPHPGGRWPGNIYACPKPGKAEREEGCESLPDVNPGGGDGDGMKNPHPTVKPVKLLRWMLKLITPPGGTVLEPFAGSGSTLVASRELDLRIIASELEPAYCDVVCARLGEPRKKA